MSPAIAEIITWAVVNEGAAGEDRRKDTHDRAQSWTVGGGKVALKLGRLRRTSKFSGMKVAGRTRQSGPLKAWVRRGRSRRRTDVLDISEVEMELRLMGHRFGTPRQAPTSAVWDAGRPRDLLVARVSKRG